jgi:hypothetical protein
VNDRRVVRDIQRGSGRIGSGAGQPYLGLRHRRRRLSLQPHRAVQDLQRCVFQDGDERRDQRARSRGFGAVTITRSVTIDGRGATGVIFANLITGVTINITDATDTAKTVRLRGLSINGGGNGLTGIKVVAAKRVSIEETVIDGFTLDGVAVASGGIIASFKNNVFYGNKKNGAPTSLLTLK